MSGPGQTSVPKTSSPASPPTTSAVTHRYMLKLSFVFNYSMLRFEWITSHNRSASSGLTLTVHSHLVNTSTDSDCVYLFLRTASFVAQPACRWLAYGSPQLMETYMIRHILLVLGSSLPSFSTTSVCLGQCTMVISACLFPGSSK